MKNSSTVIAFISAFALHLIVGGVLLMNVDLSFPKEKAKPTIINASVVSQKMFDDVAQRKKEKILQEKRRKEQLRKEREREQRERVRAQKKRKRIERERIQAAKTKALRKEQRIKTEKLLAAKKLRAKQEAEKAKKIADDKRKKQEAERLKAEKLAQEKRSREDAKRRKAEKTAREKAVKAAKEKERLRQAELDKQMEAEFEDAFSSAQTAKQLSEISRYKALIQNKISRNWQVEPNMKGKTCTLIIRLAPDGLVLSANRSKGDSKLCASAKRAALKAKTLPIPSDPEIASQFRDFDITLKPDL